MTAALGQEMTVAMAPQLWCTITIGAGYDTVRFIDSAHEADPRDVASGQQGAVTSRASVPQVLLQP